jgi:hypothetical protein
LQCHAKLSAPLFRAQRPPKYHHRRATRLLAASARSQGTVGGLKPIRDHQQVHERALVLPRPSSTADVHHGGRSRWAPMRLSNSNHVKGLVQEFDKREGSICELVTHMNSAFVLRVDFGELQGSRCKVVFPFSFFLFSFLENYAKL